MPAAALPAIAAAVGSYATGATLFGLSVFSSALLAGASSFVLSTLQNKLAGKPKMPNLAGFSARAGTAVQQIKQPITARRLVYGEARVSGPLLFAASTSANKYLHLVIAIASHEIAEMGEVWLNDEPIPADYINGAGLVTTGRYANLVRIKKHLGASGQTADPDLVAEVDDWTTDHRLSGIAYLYVRLQYSREKFPTGIPNISVWVKGRSVLDTRLAASGWSPNIALITHDFLLDEKYGVGASSGDIDSTYTDSAANTCDEIVTTANLDTTVSSVAASTDIITLTGDRLKLQTGDRVVLTTSGVAPAGLAIATDYYVIVYQRRTTCRIKLAASLADAVAGTAIDITDAGSGTHTIRKTGEPRFHGGGVIETDADIGENLRDILTGMGGDVIYTGGQWSMQAAAYETPTITLDEGDLRAPLRVQTRVSRRDRFNTVKGVYVSPLNDGQPADYPAITNATYKANDGNVEIISDLDLPVTQRPHTAQRLAKIKLELHRQEMVVEYPCNMKGLQLKAGSTVMIDNDRMGWSAKVFRVKSWALAADEGANGVPVLGVDLVLQEIASAAYDWNSGEETSVDPAPNTTLTNAYDVDAISALRVDSEAVETRDGDSTFKILLQWDPPENQFVLENGTIEVQYKQSDSDTWRPLPPLDGGAVNCEVTVAAQLNTDYDVRIRAVNNLGVPSSWTSILSFAVGTSGGVGTTEDWQLFSDSVTTNNDYGLFSDSVTTNIDRGYFT